MNSPSSAAFLKSARETSGSRSIRRSIFGATSRSAKSSTARTSMRSSSPRSSGTTTASGSVGPVRNDAPASASRSVTGYAPPAPAGSGSAAFQLATRRSRFSRAMKSMLIPFGHAS